MTLQSAALELSHRIKLLLQNEHRALVEFLAALGELDASELYLPLGYSSTWSYLRQGLLQSEAMAHYRVSAARVLRRFPQVGPLLEQGKLCMTHLSDLAKVLTESNCDAVFAEAIGKSRDDVKRIAERLAPKPGPTSPVITVPLAPPAPQLKSPAPAPGPKASAAPVQTELLTEAFARKHLTVDREYLDLLGQARDALSHTMPGAAELEVIKAGLRALVKAHEKRKGQTDKPRAPKPPAPMPPDAAIPAHIRREVWRRDNGRCQWPRPEGGVCGSTHRVQFHHVKDR